MDFILIDYENVQPKSIGVLNGKPFKLKIFLGSNQAKIPLEIARAVQALGTDAEYIQIDGIGNNALDFYIAYYIGCLASEHPEASFHIVSKDTGFDPLIRHLKSRGVDCRRTDTIPHVNAAKSPAAEANPDRVQVIIDNLMKRKDAKPAKLKTLQSTIKAMFRKEPLSAEEIDALIEQLTQRGIIRVAAGKVGYNLP